MNHDLIKTFLSIVETESISETSQSLNLSQSTVSNRLSVLEEEVNAILFTRGRGKKGTRLTENGKSFVPIAQAWMDLYLRTTHWKTSSTQNSIIIGSLETLNTCIFAPFYENIVNYMHKYNVKLQVRTRIASSLYEMLKYHEIDLGMTVHPIFFSTVDVIPLFSEEYVLVPPADSDYTNSELIDLKDLPLEDEIFLPWDQYFVSWHEEQLGLISETCISVDLLPLAIQFMLPPERWIVAPYSAAKDIARATGKSLCIPQQKPKERTCYLIKNKNPIYDKIQSLNLIEESIMGYIAQLDNITLLPNAPRSEPHSARHLFAADPRSTRD